MTSPPPALARDRRSTAPAPAVATWETELFVLRGEDRPNLIERARALADFLHRHPDTDLKDLAATLAGELLPGGARLAIVAGSTADLQARLNRLAERLADPSCKQVRDAAGAYFFETPLATQGTLALLFPGEGAQYPNMLADLCEPFPEVAATFDWCDQIAHEAGQPERSLRRVLHLPPDASDEQRAEAEARLRQLDCSIFGVLVADLALGRLLTQLQLPIAATAGHSAGELAALLAAGAMQFETVIGTQFVESMDVMQRQEDEASGTAVTLLAVGAGRATVTELAAAVAGSSVLVAMDNCPHQSVAVGPTQAMATLEAALVERGILCERLPFRRPYHTPLFEPWMGPFRELFRPVVCMAPHTPVYSCTTAGRFPDDPATIHKLTVDHWVSPVEFARMIETMYADGVRLFVEAGPRGNLSAFVEDILRGRPFAALASNVPRRSGLTQLNHLIGQLVAHQVPVNLAHLYERREPRAVAWDHSSRAGGVSPLSLPEKTQGADAPRSDGGNSDRAAIVENYLSVMEQFLDVQRDVMEAYLAGRNGAALPDLAASTPEAPFAFVGEIVAHHPGQLIVWRRPLDAHEDLYARDHSLGGVGISRVDPHQVGLPVQPMTCSLESMAEAASLLLPGKVVVALKNVRLHRWLPVEEPPTTVEVWAELRDSDEPGTWQVRADVRDLGNAFVPDGANRPAAECVVVLADHYPEPPQAPPFELTHERPCSVSVADLYRNMFHGPLFQGVKELIRHGDEGLETIVEVLPRDRYFRSNAAPRFVFDPIQMDACMHTIAGWHLEQPDWTGRIMFPIEVARFDFFGPPPPPGTRLLCRSRNEATSARQTYHGLDVLLPDGRPWLLIRGYGFWRVYLPFGHVNFFGPKDEYYLSACWPEALPPGPRPAQCWFLDPPLDLRQPVLRSVGCRIAMTPREQAEYEALAGPDANRGDWLFRRIVAKDAARSAWTDRHGEKLFLADIETELTSTGRLRARFRDGRSEALPTVAVAIADGVACALSAFHPYVGMALAKVEDSPEARLRLARQAVASALDVPAADDWPAELVGDFADVTLSPAMALAGRSLRVAVLPRGNLLVATTLCEAAP